MVESQLQEKIDPHRLPRHIAVIMDGNGRWAKERILPRVAGHKEGINSVREITRICGEFDVKHLTLYTFSTENWGRPKSEVSALMTLLLKTISIEVKELHKKNVRFTTIGDLSMLPESTQKRILDGIEMTKSNSGLNLCLALNYGSRQEMVSAVQSIAERVKIGELDSTEINETIFSQALSTANMSDPDLLIRTSGECRLSNFLLWQIAYAELFFTDILWPDFRKEDFFNAIVDYQNRERRFGKTSEQL